MYHEHPLRILRYSAKNIWLLIFPLLRGIRAFTLDVNKLYNWLKGAWFDIAVLGVIIIFGLVRWYCSKITVTDEALIHTDGVFVRIRKAIPLKNISAVTVEHSFYLRPFGGMIICCDTSAGIFRSSDMKLMVNKKVCTEIIKTIPDVDEKESKIYRHKPSLVSVLLFSVFFSSSFSGAVYIAAFFFKGGDIAKDIISASFDKITEETSKIPLLVIQKIPAAAIGIGSFFLATWVLSFAVNMLRYYGFSVKSDGKMIKVRCGTLTQRCYRINASQVNYADLRQNLIMKLSSAVTVNISCAGYGVNSNQLPVIFPIKKQKNLGTGLEKIGICTGEKRKYRSGITSLWQYIWLPVIISLCIYPAVHIIPAFFPKFSNLSIFAVFMAEIPAIWAIVVKIVAAVTSSIAIYDNKIMVRYSKGIGFHTVVAEKKRLVKIEIAQTPFQRMFGKCNIGLYFNGETTRRHLVKAIKVSDAKQISEMLGYTYFIEEKNKKK